jgi:hypothetical protein
MLLTKQDLKTLKQKNLRHSQTSKLKHNLYHPVHEVNQNRNSLTVTWGWGSVGWKSSFCK